LIGTIPFGQLVFLGPDLFIDENGKAFADSLPRLLKADFHPDEGDGSEVVYYPEDDLFYFKKDTIQVRSLSKIAHAYQHCGEKINLDVMQKLAHIPFPLFISVSPDTVLKQIFEDNNWEHDFGYYKKNEVSKKVNPPSKTKPLIYNIFGTYEDEDSLIFSNNALLEFMFSVFGTKTLPDDILHLLRNSTHFLFIGLKFDKWYMRPLLKLLEMNMAGKSFIQYASIQNLNKPVITFCEKNFTIEFVQNNPMSFVDKLYEKCGNFLRKDEEHAALKTSEKVSKLLINDNLEEAISLLKNVFKNNRDEDLVKKTGQQRTDFERRCKCEAE